AVARTGGGGDRRAAAPLRPALLPVSGQHAGNGGAERAVRDNLRVHQRLRSRPPRPAGVLARIASTDRRHQPRRHSRPVPGRVHQRPVQSRVLLSAPRPNAARAASRRHLRHRPRLAGRVRRALVVVIAGHRV
ncbi:hypothetical protein EV177_011066, partial [Coemansia sp. RSA 1804]